MERHAREAPVRQRGFSLAEAMVAATLLAGAAYAVLRESTLRARKENFLTVNRERETLRRSLLERVSCGRSLEPLTVESCATGTLVALRERSGADLVAKPFGVLEGWVLQASCVKDLGMKVVAMRLRPGVNPVWNETKGWANAVDDFQIEPVTRAPLSPTHPKAALFSGEGLDSALCPSEDLTISVGEGLTPLGKCKLRSARFDHGYCPGDAGSSCTYDPLERMDQVVVRCPADYPFPLSALVANGCGTQDPTNFRLPRVGTSPGGARCEARSPRHPAPVGDTSVVDQCAKAGLSTASVCYATCCDF